MKKSLPLAAFAGLALATGSAHGALYVYEGFQYGNATSTGDRTGADLLHGQPDGSGGDTNATGLSGTWQEQLTGTGGVNTTTDLRMATGSLSFGDLATSGNHVRADSNLNNDVLARTITSSLASGSELWFSFLANQLDTRSATQEGIVIGNQAVNNSQVGQDDGSTGLAGFGVASPNGGNNWAAYGWDGTSQVAGASVTLLGTNLFVGRIIFGTGTGGADEYSLFYYDDGAGNTNITADIANLTQIGITLEVDVDENTLDTLSVTRQVNTAYDEIRIGESLDDVVVPIPEPTTALLGGLGTLLLLRRRR